MFPDFSSIRAKEKYFRSLEGERKYDGKYLVIINKGKTKMEGKADLVFHESIGHVLNTVELSHKKNL